MARILATLLCLGLSFVSWTDLRAAAARPKVVIAHAAMNFPGDTPLRRLKTKASSPNTVSDSEVIYMCGGPTLLSGMSSGNIEIGLYR